MTSCEFVVVIAPASSRYETPPLAVAALTAGLTFVAIFAINDLAFDTWPHPLLMLLEASVAGVLAWALCARVPAIQRRLIRRWRQVAAVDTAAAATFTREKIALTSGRNAALLFISMLEGEVRLMPDSGLVAKVPEPALGEVQSAMTHATQADPVHVVEQALEKLGQLCASAFPRPAGDQNELPDKPQILLP